MKRSWANDKALRGLGRRPRRLFDRITRTHLSGNQPDDIIWDGTGAGNVFSGNSCSTSSPSWICS